MQHRITSRFYGTGTVVFKGVFVWVDETGSDARNYMRKFGFSLRGMRAECHRIILRGERISAVAAISSDGLTIRV